MSCHGLDLCLHQAVCSWSTDLLNTYCVPGKVPDTGTRRRPDPSGMHWVHEKAVEWEAAVLGVEHGGSLSCSPLLAALGSSCARGTRSECVAPTQPKPGSLCDFPLPPCFFYVPGGVWKLVPTTGCVG